MDDALSHIRSKLSERKKELERFLGQGTVKDHSEYMKICGTIQGLGFADELIEDLATQMETADE